MKRRFLFIVMILLTAKAMAYSYYYQGIYYDVLSSEACQVTYYTYSSYSGSVNIPAYSYSQSDNITYKVCAVGKNAFDANTSLSAVVFPTELLDINDYAFRGCSKLGTISFPKYVRKYGNSSFEGCTALQSIYVNNTTLVDLSSVTNVFKGVNVATCVLHVPIGMKSAYAAANQWKDFVNIVDDINPNITPMSQALSGYGTSSYPYCLSSIGDLKLMASWINAGTNLKAYYKLTANIDWSKEYNEWVPIGNDANRFQGNFDGNNYTVTGLHLGTSSSHKYVDVSGFFGYAKDAQISNLSVSWNSLYTENNVSTYVGGIAGSVTCSYSATTPMVINNCHSYGDINGISEYTNCYIGGLIGYAGAYDKKRSVTIINSHSEADVNGFGTTYSYRTSVGGLVGYADSYVYIVNSYSKGSISGVSTSQNSFGAYSEVGGILGTAYDDVSILNCYETGDVTSGSSTSFKNASAAGIVASGNNTDTIEYCHAMASNVKAYSRNFSESHRIVISSGEFLMKNNYAYTNMSISSSKTQGLDQIDGQDNLTYVLMLSQLNKWVDSLKTFNNIKMRSWIVPNVVSYPEFGTVSNSVFNVIKTKEWSLRQNNNELTLTKLPSKELLEVYNTQGVLCFSKRIDSDSELITLPTRGLYVVKVGLNAVKVIY